LHGPIRIKESKPHGQEVVIVGSNVIRVNAPGDEAARADTIHISHISQDEFTESAGFLSDYSAETQQAIDELALRMFGFDEMKPFQHAILSRTLQGEPVFGIAATGGGKSECYILPSMLLPGITLVVSPLRSLMLDQLRRLQDRYGLDRLCTIINSDVDSEQREKSLRRMEQGYYKLVYFTPEQLTNGWVLDSLARCKERIRYIAFDEAHCISQWGHEFRPAYLSLVERLRERDIRPVLIALTATASQRVRDDVCDELGLLPRLVQDGGDIFVDSSNRPEINLVVHVCKNSQEKVDWMLRYLQRHMDARNREGALVFMPHAGGRRPVKYLSRDLAEEKGRVSAEVPKFAAYLEHALDHRVQIHHGNLLDSPNRNADIDFKVREERPLGDMTERRREVEQRKFVEQSSAVMVATKGFGMGIDKSDIRLVLHRTPPENLESYAQESGRAGRDGTISTAVLLYSPDRLHRVKPKRTTGERADREPLASDRQIQNQFIEGRYIRAEDVVVMRAFLRQLKRLLIVDRFGEHRYRYFTSDEAIAYIDGIGDDWESIGLAGPFSWPDFRKRYCYPDESPLEKEALEDGHTYAEKRSYLVRVVEALFRVRPRLSRRSGRVPLLRSFSKCRARLNLKFSRADRPIRAPEILESNRYFGARLRELGFTAQTLDALLRQVAEQEDFTLLARALNTSFRETATLLRDISTSDEDRDREGKVRKTLLAAWLSVPDYGYGSRRLSNQMQIQARGALRRLKKADAMKLKVYEKRGESLPTDWLAPTKAEGWEVEVGEPVSDDEKFSEYLERFLELHSRREAQDRENYTTLLTEYVGVKADGTVESSGATRCLRAVLLGYLRSPEMIDGGNCRSCSRCVQAEELDRYDLAARREVVRPVPLETADFFYELEERMDWIPAVVDLDQLSAQIEASRERALLPYLRGRIGQLLEEYPNHLGAMATRLHLLAMEDENPDGEQLEIIVRKIAKLGSETRNVMLPIVERCADRAPEHIGTQLVAARLSRDLGKAELAAQRLKRTRALLELRASDPETLDPYRAVTYLMIALYRDNGPLANADLHSRYVMDSALVAPNASVARTEFHIVFGKVPPDALREALGGLKDRRTTPVGLVGFLVASLDWHQHSEAAWQEIIAWLEANHADLPWLFEGEAVALLAAGGVDRIAEHEDLLESLLTLIAGQGANPTARAAILQGVPLLLRRNRSCSNRLLGELALQVVDAAQGDLEAALPEYLREDSAERRAFWLRLLPHIKLRRAEHLKRWLVLLPISQHLAEGPECALALLEGAGVAAGSEEVDDNVLEQLEHMVEGLLQTTVAARAHRGWLVVCRQHPRVAMRHLRRCRDLSDVPRKWLAEAHSAWATHRELLPPHILLEHLSEIRAPGPERENWIVEAHRWWLAHGYRFRTNRQMQYIEMLIADDPSRISEAEEVVFSLLEKRRLNRERLRSVLFSIADKAQGEATRITIAMTLVRCLDKTCEKQPRCAIKEVLKNFDAIRGFQRRLDRSMEHEERRSDLFASVMGYLSEQKRGQWLTPIRFQVEALVKGRRMVEARTLAERHPRLRLGNMDLKARSSDSGSRIPASDMRTVFDAYEREHRLLLEAYDQD